VVWTVPSPSRLRGQVAPTQSLRLPHSGLGSALPVKGPPTSRAFTHAVSDVVSSVRTPPGAARVRRVASYTKGQCLLMLRALPARQSRGFHTTNTAITVQLGPRIIAANLRKLLADALPHTPPATPMDHALTVLLMEADGGRITPHPSVTGLLDGLRADPELEMFHGRTQVVAAVGRGVTYVFLAEWLLRRAGIVGPDQAVTDLERYVKAEWLPYRATVAVGGIKADHVSDLGHDMQLVPWKDVADSNNKRAIDEVSPFHRSFYEPGAALVREVELPRIHVDPSETRIHLRSMDWSDITDMLLCLGLFGPTAPVLLASWLEPPDWAPVITGSYSMPFAEGSGAARPLPETAMVEASRLFSTWLGLTEERRAELRIPMQRLNSAMRRSRPVDSAIDLGIALESTFLHDTPEDRRGLTSKLRRRASQWLGSTPEERENLSLLVRDLYEARSEAVHRGQASSGARARPAAGLLEEGYKLAAGALVLLISARNPTGT